MKLFYTDEVMQEVLKNHCFPKMQEEISTSVPGRTMPAVLIRHNASKCQRGCLMAINNKGILLVLMNSWDAQKAEGHVFLPFSDMQGAQIKKGILISKITLQLKDGARFKVQVVKRNTRHLPHQNENLRYICSMLESKRLGEMQNAAYTKSVKAERKSSFVYTATLIIMLMIPFSQIAKISSRNVFIGLCLATLAIHCMLYILISSLLEKDRKFKKEYNAILKQFGQDEDEAGLYAKLVQMGNKPKTKEGKELYYFMLLTLAVKLEKYEEALSYIEGIDTGQDQKLREAVEIQRDYIQDQLEVMRNDGLGI